MTCGCGRESRSAVAAAVSAWRLRPLVLVLVPVLFSVMPHGASSGGLGKLTGRNITCNRITYPFGVHGNAPQKKGDALPGFEVTCGPNNESMLPIGNHSYKIDSVSVEGGSVVIFAGPIRQFCYDGNGKPTQATRIDDLSLQGTPFSFSKRNNLVATGCNYRLVASFGNSDNSPWQNTSCSPYCNGSSNTVINGSCHNGVACCEVPMPMDDAQEFSITLNPPGHVPGDEDGTCIAAFFLDQDEEVFMGGQMPLKDALVAVGDRRMILDWAVGLDTCDQAANNLMPLCNSLSDCVDAPRGVGYLCRCNPGYEGNPYAEHGCLDINECRNANNNNCSRHATCKNTPGGFTCSCPRIMSGDGYKTGTGCKKVPMTSGPPMQQPQGLGVCTHPDKNPCTNVKYCSDEQGVVSCYCPQGMRGDGLKTGNGCQKPFPTDPVLGVGLALVVAISTTSLCYYWALKRRKVRRKRAELFRKNGGLLLQQRFSAITSQSKDSSAKIFSAEELRTATNNYNETRILGRGAYGTVYKGVLPDETVVAVKKSRVFDESQVEQFVNEITILSQTDHPNVVKLLGCCLETEVPLLVYEFIPNGTLFQHIHNRSAPCSLTWEDTLRMAAETAEALAYLHSNSSIPIIHRDIKSSNILLDENFVAKISDFGASRSVPFDQTHVTTLIQGTIGYLDPEYFQSGQLTAKSDVYSFGVVLAELLTRQKPFSVGRPEESCSLAMHMVILVNEGCLLNEIEPRILAEAGEEQIYAVAQLSVRCLNMNGQERPMMKEVASVLEELRRSFTKEQTMRRTDEQCNEQGNLLREASSTSSLHRSEVSAQLSMVAEMKASCHTPR